MISCVALFMSFMIEFQHANCCWDSGRFGWFDNSKQDPMGTWFTVDDNRFIKYYAKGETVFADVSSAKNKRKDAKFYVENKECKLDGKKYYYSKYSIKE